MNESSTGTQIEVVVVVEPLWNVKKAKEEEESWRPLQPLASASRVTRSFLEIVDFFSENVEKFV